MDGNLGQPAHVPVFLGWNLADPADSCYCKLQQLSWRDLLIQQFHSVI